MVDNGLLHSDMAISNVVVRRFGMVYELLPFHMEYEMIAHPSQTTTTTTTTTRHAIFVSAENRDWSTKKRNNFLALSAVDDDDSPAASCARVPARGRE